jgi:hypothetical protein
LSGIGVDFVSLFCRHSGLSGIGFSMALKVNYDSGQAEMVAMPSSEKNN